MTMKAEERQTDHWRHTLPAMHTSVRREAVIAFADPLTTKTQRAKVSCRSRQGLDGETGGGQCSIMMCCKKRAGVHCGVVVQELCYDTEGTMRLLVAHADGVLRLVEERALRRASTSCTYNTGGGGDARCSRWSCPRPSLRPSARPTSRSAAARSSLASPRCP
jgi:hypothetical protein